MPCKFFSHICQYNIYNLLISTKLKYQDVLEIVKNFCDEKENYEQMQIYLEKNLRLYQFVYANLFPKYFSRIDDYGIQSKLEFENIFKTWLNQKNISWQLPLYDLKEEKIDSVIANPPTPLIDEKIEEIEVKVKEINEEKKSKKKRKISIPSEKKIAKRNEKKKKLEVALQQNDHVFSLINYKK